MPPETEKPFDYLASKRPAQAAHDERTRHMSDAQWLADLKQRVAEGPLGDWWRRIGEQSDQPPRTGAADTPHRSFSAQQGYLPHAASGTTEPPGCRAHRRVAALLLGTMTVEVA